MTEETKLFLCIGLMIAAAVILIARFPSTLGVLAAAFASKPTARCCDG